jgi:hypothetical protein
MSRKIMWLSSLLLLVIFVHTGVCQTFESEEKPLEFYWTQAKKIVIGMTTEDEVRKLLGTPSYATGGVKALLSGRRLVYQNPFLYYGILPGEGNEVGKYAVKIIIDKETGKVKALVINEPK